MKIGHNNFCSLQMEGYHFHKNSGAPNEKKLEKGLGCSILLSRIVLWPFRGIFLRANTI